MNLWIPYQKKEGASRHTIQHSSYCCITTDLIPDKLHYRFALIAAKKITAMFFSLTIAMYKV